MNIAKLITRLSQFDAQMMASPLRTRLMILGAALLAIFLIRLWMIPAEFLDTGFNRTDQVGIDYLADSYAGRVVANNPGDMYLKEEVEQSAREARWDKPRVSPYPPASLLVMGAMHDVGAITGLGFYGVLVLIDAAFVLLALAYCLKTRWYIFAFTFVNVFLAMRVHWMGNATDLLILFGLMIAVHLSMWRPAIAHLVVAATTCMKPTPIYYFSNLFKFGWIAGAAAIVLLLAGYVLPSFLLEGYLDIWTMQGSRDTEKIFSALNGAGVGFLAPFAVALAYLAPLSFVGWFCTVLFRAQHALKWDWADIIGWSAVPFALLFSLRVVSMRLVFLAMLIPDKRGHRTAFVFIMGLADMMMMAAGFAYNSPVRDVIWFLLGIGLLVTIANILLYQIRQVDPEAARFNVPQMIKLVFKPQS